MNQRSKVRRGESCFQTYPKHGPKIWITESKGNIWDVEPFRLMFSSGTGWVVWNLSASGRSSLTYSNAWRSRWDHYHGTSSTRIRLWFSLLKRQKKRLMLRRIKVTFNILLRGCGWLVYTATPRMFPFQSSNNQRRQAKIERGESSNLDKLILLIHNCCHSTRWQYSNGGERKPAFCIFNVKRRRLPNGTTSTPVVGDT